MELIYEKYFSNTLHSLRVKEKLYIRRLQFEIQFHKELMCSLTDCYAHEGSGDTEGKGVAVVPETLNIVSQNWCQECGQEATTVDGEIEDGEKTLDVFLLLKQKLSKNLITITFDLLTSSFSTYVKQ